MTGLEPATYELEVHCSILLNYIRILRISAWDYSWTHLITITLNPRSIVHQSFKDLYNV